MTGYATGSQFKTDFGCSSIHKPFLQETSHFFSLLCYIYFVRSICYPIQKSYNSISSLTLPCASHFILAKQNNSSNVKCRKSVKNELMIINKYV